MKEFLCETQDLAIGYGKTPLASGIALGANPGQILVLVGPNGAGKSTLLKTLAGQLAPLGGTVLLDGQDLTAYTGTARAQKLALMLPHTRRTEPALSLPPPGASLTPGGWAFCPTPTGRPCRMHWKLPELRISRTGTSTASVMVSVSVFCWPVPSASSLKCCCWTSPPPFWTSRAKSSC